MAAADSLDPYGYPYPGFHFELTLFKGTQKWEEMRCQEVSGVDFTMEYDGSENPNLPLMGKSIKYQELVVSKGVVSGSSSFDKELFTYMRDKVMKPELGYIDLVLILLDGDQQPKRAWTFRNAVISKWKTSGFSAKDSQLLIDEISFKYFDLAPIDWA